MVEPNSIGKIERATKIIREFNNNIDYYLWWDTVLYEWRFEKTVNKVEYFNCKYSKRNKKEYDCKARLKAIFEDDRVYVEQSETQHDHTPKMNVCHLMPDELKQSIKHLMIEGCDKSQILRQLKVHFVQNI